MSSLLFEILLSDDGKATMMLCRRRCELFPFAFSRFVGVPVVFATTVCCFGRAFETLPHPQF
jgi:hypothetical protein